MSFYTIGSDCLLHISEYLDGLSCARLSATCKFLSGVLNQHGQTILVRYLKNYQTPKRGDILKELASFAKRRKPNSPFFEIMRVIERAEFYLSYMEERYVKQMPLSEWQVEIICLILRTNETPLYVSAERRYGKTTVLRICSILLWYSVPNFEVAYLQQTHMGLDYDIEKDCIEDIIKSINVSGSGKLYIIKHGIKNSQRSYETIIHRTSFNTLDESQIAPSLEPSIELVLVEDICYLDASYFFNRIITKENERKIRAITSYRKNVMLIHNTICHYASYDHLALEPIYIPGLGKFTQTHDRFLFHDDQPHKVRGFTFEYTTKPIDEKIRSMITSGLDSPASGKQKRKQY